MKLGEPQTRRRPSQGDNRPILLRLVREQAARYRWAYGAALFFMAVIAACVTTVAFFVGTAVNATTLTHDFNRVLLICALIILVFIIKGLSQYGQAVLLTRARVDTTAAFRVRMFDRLLAESMEHLSSRHSSEILNRLRVSTEAPAQVMDLTIVRLGREGMSLLGLSAVMIHQDAWLTAICLTSIPLVLVLARRSRRRLDTVSKSYILAYGRMTEVIQEALQGMRLIKTFGIDGAARERAHRQIEAVRDADQTITRLKWRVIPWLDALSGCVVALILLYGSYRIIMFGATPGQLVSFLTAFMLAYEPIQRLARYPAEVTDALAGVQMLYETLDAEPSEPSDAAKPDLVVREGRVELNQVVFSYRDSDAVLRELSLVAGPRQVTALVGHSGSGKSTIFSLLLRLYECRAGTILIDGQDIANVTRRSVRDNIAYLGQDTFLFHGTIEENIAVGQLGASRDQIIAAAKAAQAHDFIVDLSRGYDTPVGENGLALSAGQRQRIAIARAFLKNAPIILLDEPTASLDTLSEREIQRSIARLCEDRTVLVIAHRMHTVVDASTIYVIGAGRVVESGDHAALLKGAGTYQALQAQMAN